MMRSVNIEKRREYQNKYYHRHKEEIRQRQRERNNRLRVEVRQYHREYKRRIKGEVLAHYGNGMLVCVVCGENSLPCLSIDHVAGGGKKHRRQASIRGNNIYGWLRKQGFPSGYQTLCMNCQFIKREQQLRSNIK